MSRSPRFLIMAGGTGGHVFPALAVAKALREQGSEVEWLGTQKGIEARVVPEAGFLLHSLAITGLRGRSLLDLVKAPYLILRAIWVVMAILRRYKPQVVIGLGGYVTGPGGVAARLMGIPLIIHEQNAVAGTTNRLLARIAQRGLTAFPQVLPGAICIGNPVRSEITALPEPATRLNSLRDPLRLLVLGGSLGASALNQLVPKALAKLPLDERPEVWHQAGPQHAQATELTYRELNLAVAVEPFIGDMAAAFGWADLVICRAGALTVSELSAAGLAAILVPYPHAIDDHQTANARWLVAAGGALMRSQSELSPEWLARTLGELRLDRARLLTMAQAARQVAKPDATQAFVAQILELSHG